MGSRARSPPRPVGACVPLGAPRVTPAGTPGHFRHGRPFGAAAGEGAAEPAGLLRAATVRYCGCGGVVVVEGGATVEAVGLLVVVVVAGATVVVVVGATVVVVGAAVVVVDDGVVVDVGTVTDAATVVVVGAAVSGGTVVAATVGTVPAPAGGTDGMVTGATTVA